MRPGVHGAPLELQCVFERGQRSACQRRPQCLQCAAVNSVRRHRVGISVVTARGRLRRRPGCSTGSTHAIRSTSAPAHSGRESSDHHDASRRHRPVASVSCCKTLRSASPADGVSTIAARTWAMRFCDFRHGGCCPRRLAATLPPSIWNACSALRSCVISGLASRAFTTNDRASPVS